MFQQPTSRERPTVVIARQRAEIDDLEQLLDVLKGALVAQGCEEFPVHEEWMRGLRRQERAFVGILYAAFPRVVNNFALVEMLPGNAADPLDRLAKIGSSVAYRTRRVVGESAIETIHGVGYRLSREFYERIRKERMGDLADAA